MPAILDDPFDSPKALIQGAKEDVIEFEARWTAYASNARCVPIIYTDRETGHKIIKIRVKDNPPARLRYLASNIINNIRHALDQAANAAAVLLGKNKRDGYFPFGIDKVGIEDVIKRHCRGFNIELIDYFRSLKPNGGGDDLLSAVGKATGPNKHQITLDIYTDVPRYGLFDFMVDITGPAEVGGGWDKNKRELLLVTLTSSSAQTTICINAQTRLPLVVEIGGSAAFTGHEATALLNTLIGKVDGILLGVETETARILASRR